MIDGNGRVCVIGLDGATFAVLDQWIAAGAMPNLADLIARGSRTELISTMPPVTGPAWTSMTTGMDPGAHGVFAFVKWSKDRTRARAVHSGDVPVPRFWDLIGQTGRTVGVYNVPVTYPASEVPGFMVTGMLTPRPGRSMTHPATLYDDLAERGLVALARRLRPEPTWRNVRQLFAMHEQREAAIRYLLDRFNPDVFMGVFQEVDRLQHRFWPYCDLKTGGPDPAIRSWVDRLFRRVDKTIGLLIDFFGPETRFFLVSDHGSGPVRALCLLNTFLARKGFLSVDWPRLRRRNLGRRMRRAADAVFGAIGARGTGKRLIGAAERFLRTGEPQVPMTLLPTDAVNWSRTRAFVITQSERGIRINLRGRDPHGIVEPGREYDHVLRRLTRSLETLADPASGERLVTQILRRDEVHHGPYAHEAPDLYVVVGDGAVKTVSALGARVIADHERRGHLGDHRMEGVLIAAGPGIRTRADAHARIADVAPTALYAMGVPVPHYMDGKVLLPLFEEAYVAAHPVQHSDVAPAARTEGCAAASTSEADEAAIRERLKRLGYL